jgi:hypothetical protein
VHKWLSTVLEKEGRSATPTHEPFVTPLLRKNPKKRELTLETLAEEVYQISHVAESSEGMYKEASHVAESSEGMYKEASHVAEVILERFNHRRMKLIHRRMMMIMMLNLTLTVFKTKNFHEH